LSAPTAAGRLEQPIPLAASAGAERQRRRFFVLASLRASIESVTEFVRIDTDR
jgi:hypothetical protein